MTADLIEARVALGMSLLDDTRPGWDVRIDLRHLDMRTTRQCVIGQEYAGHPDVLSGQANAFDVGTDELLADAADINVAIRAHGFDRDADHYDYIALAAEWRRAILARRGGAS